MCKYIYYLNKFLFFKSSIEFIASFSFKYKLHPNNVEIKLNEK